MNVRILTLSIFASVALTALSGPVFAQSAAQAAYDARMRTYQRQQEEYWRAREAYDAEIRRYENRGPYGAPYYGYDSEYSRVSYAPFESLDQIDDKVLINKPVETIDGQYVGRVTNQRTIGNMVTELQVKINSARITWVLSSRLRYDPAADIVVTDLTADQMARRSRIDF